MAIEFNYPNGHPTDYKSQEEIIIERYKQVVKEFPEHKITFNWTGKGWSVGASDDSVVYRMNELDNENKP